MSEWTVTMRTPDGDEMIVHPENKATHGVYLAEDQVKGDIIDAPVKTEWDSLALQEGGFHRGTDYEYRDIHLGFHVTDNSGLSAEEADSLLRMKFDYEEDEWDPNPLKYTQLDLETEMSGVRTLNLLMAETPANEYKRDPLMEQYMNPQYMLRAGQPMWEGHAADGKPYRTYTWDFPSGNHSWEFEIENPTDRPARHTWIISGGPGTQATLPDVSWVGPKGDRLIAGPHSTRMIACPPITALGGGLRVTLERGKLMVKDANGTNALGRMPVPGQRFLHRIPHYTRKTSLIANVANVPAGGGRIELRIPLLWSRPYGLEKW